MQKKPTKNPSGRQGKTPVEPTDAELKKEKALWRDYKEAVKLYFGTIIVVVEKLLPYLRIYHPLTRKNIEALNEWMASLNTSQAISDRQLLARKKGLPPSIRPLSESDREASEASEKAFQLSRELSRKAHRENQEFLILQEETIKTCLCKIDCYAVTLSIFPWRFYCNIPIRGEEERTNINSILTVVTWLSRMVEVTDNNNEQDAAIRNQLFPQWTKFEHAYEEADGEPDYRWEFDKEKREVTLNGRGPVKLPQRLFNLWYYFYAHPGKDIKPKTLFKEGWKYKETLPRYERTVQEGINALRYALAKNRLLGLSKEELDLIIRDKKRGRKIISWAFYKQINL